ncbi:prolyl oligopeptidase family serine peptidase [Sphingomonas sp. AR_OL41]|uniref:S9 family peptidase n=1 Tax=Sphingomonas sp. AR_OL41 TaxID=3042729 RepID=UPI00248171F0|nr:alpha/beta fold hydrolase [Sphingomonas sp. AR_OL41]MDH7971161.1 prolyl oligopeptidase family serine peptidase [Sphingomonas sp. AR_OL41]
MIFRHGFKLTLCVPAILLGAALHAQPAADDLATHLALPIASGLAGARDVPRFAWIENAAGVHNIWVGGPDIPGHPLTAYRDDDGVELSEVTLSHDGTTLAYVRGGDSEYPDGALPNTGQAGQTPKQELFVMPVAGGPAIRLGEGHAPAFSASGDRIAFSHKGDIWLWDRTNGARKIAAVPGSVGELTWSPDGGALLFVSDSDDHAFVTLLDIATGKPRYIGAGLGFATDPVFSPDGKQVAFIRFVDPPADAAPDSAGYWSLAVADAATGVTRTLWRAASGVGGEYYGTRGRDLFWSADGKLVFPWERSGWVHAFAIDAAAGGEPRELTPGAFEVETFTLGADRRSLVYAANAGNLDSRHVWRRDLTGGPATQLSSGAGFESVPTLAGGALAAIATDATHPAHPVLIATGLPVLGPAPSVTAFVVPEPVTFTAADGVTVHGQLFHARGAGKHPALIFVHGGPRRQMLPGFHPSYYYSNAYILNQHFAAQGYDVLSVNYRSGTGYGHAFRAAPEIARAGASEYRDVLAAGRWLAARGDVDPARIGIWGGSWGGYLTALALARNSDLFAAGVDFHGVHTMVRPVEKTLSPDAEAKARQLQWKSSPMGAVDGWRSPVLLIHGDDDRNVDFGQSLLLARALTARHVPFRELVFPGERHDFFRYADWLASYHAADAFLDRTLMKKQPLP